jgi:hypothetical protein
VTVRIIGAHYDELATVQILAAFQAAQALNMKVVAHCRARVFIAVNVFFTLVTDHFLVAIIAIGVNLNAITETRHQLCS